MGLNFIEMADEIEALFGIKTDVVAMSSIKPEYLQSCKKEYYICLKEKPSMFITSLKNFIANFIS